MKRNALALVCMTLLAACSSPQEPAKSAASAAPATPAAPATAPSAPPLLSGVEPGQTDPAVRAQDDFYRHTNGKWLDAFQIPADKGVYGSFTAIDDAIQGE